MLDMAVRQTVHASKTVLQNLVPRTANPGRGSNEAPMGEMEKMVYSIVRHCLCYFYT